MPGWYGTSATTAGPCSPGPLWPSGAVPHPLLQLLPLPYFGEVLSDPSIPVNINFVFGPSDKVAQTWMAPLPYLVLYMAALFVVFFLPTHLVLRIVVRQAWPVPVSTTA